MDPLAHTLTGASLAAAGLRRLSPLATATLVLGANAPDIDAVTYFASRDLSLGFRRGWTHGVLALAVLPAVLTGLLLLWHRWRGREGPPPRPRVLLALAYLAILTHPALDWLNTYGMRWLMPFDGRWSYGDALFIVDPWFWLLTGAGTAAVWARGWVGTPAALLVAAATTSLVMGAEGVPAATSVAWIAGLAIVAALRVAHRDATRASWVARAGLCGAAIYIAGMLGLTSAARREASAWLEREGVQGQVVMAGPVAANPFVRDIVARDGDTYVFAEFDWMRADRLRFSDPPVPRGPTGPVVEAALAAPHVQGLRRWIRFPSYEVLETAAGFEVRIRDVRYSRSRGSGLGTAVVHVSRSLQPSPVERPVE